MDELIKFLRARLDAQIEDASRLDGVADRIDSFVIDLSSEADFLRDDVAAKRAIIELHHPVDPCDAHDASFRTITCDTLLALSAVYADHPDFRAEWRLGAGTTPPGE